MKHLLSLEGFNLEEILDIIDWQKLKKIQGRQDPPLPKGKDFGNDFFKVFYKNKGFL